MGKRQIESSGLNRDLSIQITCLLDIVRGNEVLYEVIVKSSELGLPNHYVGAGCLAQTVWNHSLGFSPGYGIDDIDIVYFDPSDSDGSREAEMRDKCSQLLGPIPFRVDLVNQARVHFWYMEEFGYGIEPYQSSEQAINTWPTTATAIGLRLTRTDGPIVYAPYGLNDLFGLVVRANKVQITRKIYEDKVRKWLAKWPELEVIPW